MGKVTALDGVKIAKYRGQVMLMLQNNFLDSASSAE